MIDKDNIVVKSKVNTLESNSNKIILGLFFGSFFFTICIIFLIFDFSSSSNKIISNSYPPVRKMKVSEQVKVDKIINSFTNHPIGIDISHFQGRINWSKVGLINDSISLAFVILRATMGKNSVDRRFKENWYSVKDSSIVMGAYHYYRPNENSTKQANNFIANVSLNNGDIIPILDIEQQSSIQSISRLRKGLLNWLKIIEEHYGVNPIIYTGDNFYNTHLNKPEFNKYPKWIANYNYISSPSTSDWDIWQFSEAVKVDGINELVDLNILASDSLLLNKLIMKDNI